MKNILRAYQKWKEFLWIGGVAAAIITLLVMGARASQKNVTTITNPGSLRGIQASGAPWPVESTRLRERLDQIGLPALAQEGTALHIHQHLDIFIDGKPIAIPAGVGVNAVAGFISDIHTHDASGIIHVESPVQETFTLGQFFDIWGVAFTAQRIGGYQNQGSRSLKVFANGSLYSGDPRQLALASYQEIIIAYGTDQELPNPIPSTYNFPVGY